MIAACKKRFAKRGWSASIGQGYGLTETCAFSFLFLRASRLAGIDSGLCTAGGLTAHMPIEEMASRPTCIGRIFPNCEIRVVDEERRDVPVGTPGELWIRSPAVMKCVARATDWMRHAC